MGRGVGKGFLHPLWESPHVLGAKAARPWPPLKPWIAWGSGNKPAARTWPQPEFYLQRMVWVLSGGSHPLIPLSHWGPLIVPGWGYSGLSPESPAPAPRGSFSQGPPPAGPVQRLFDLSIQRGRKGAVELSPGWKCYCLCLGPAQLTLVLWCF